MSSLTINETTLYYFYSTISQTLAAILGLLGAFVILRVQQIRQQREIKAKAVRDIEIRGTTTFINSAVIDSYEIGKFTDVYKHALSAFNDKLYEIKEGEKFKNKRIVEEALRSLKLVNDMHKSILTSFWGVVQITTLLIVASLMFITAAPLNIANSKAVIGGMMFLVIFDLFMVQNTIRQGLKD